MVLCKKWEKVIFTELRDKMLMVLCKKKKMGEKSNNYSLQKGIQPVLDK
jgi:hypothetical protein